MKDIRIELEISAMAYFYYVTYDNQKKIAYFNSFGKELEKKVSDKDLEIFWNSINNIGVWSWKKNYEQFPIPPTDGEGWELKLRDGKENAKYTKGYMTFPDNFNKLMEAFDDLVGIDYDEENRFVDYSEEEE